MFMHENIKNTHQVSNPDLTKIIVLGNHLNSSKTLSNNLIRFTGLEEIKQCLI